MNYQLYRYERKKHPGTVIEYLVPKDVNGNNTYRRIVPKYRKYEELYEWIKISFDPGICFFGAYVRDVSDEEAFLELL